MPQQFNFNSNDDLLRMLMSQSRGNQFNGTQQFKPQNYTGFQFSNTNTMQPTNQDASNMNMAKSDSEGSVGKGSGAKAALGGLSPLQMGINGASALTDAFGAANQPGFNYGQDNYTVQDAQQYEGDKAKNIAQSAAKGIPVIGGLLGGIFGQIAQSVAANKAAERAHFILGNRESKIKNLEDYQMDKISQNNFLKSSDLFKNYYN